MKKLVQGFKELYQHEPYKFIFVWTMLISAVFSGPTIVEQIIIGLPLFSYFALIHKISVK